LTQHSLKYIASNKTPFITNNVYELIHHDARAINNLDFSLFKAEKCELLNK